MDYRNGTIVPIRFVDQFQPLIPIVIETWKLIDLEGVVKNYYWVSNTGKVVNIHGQLLKPQLVNSGYWTYRLYTGKKGCSADKYKTILAHRLVMLFHNPIPNPDLYTVNHDDMDKNNNFEYNLSWMLQKENNEEKERNCRTSGSRNYQAKFDHLQLRTIIQELQKGTSYSNILKMIGIEDTPNNRDYIGNIKRGKTYQREIQIILDE